MFRTVMISTTALAIAAGMTAPAVASPQPNQAPVGAYTAVLNAKATTHVAFGSKTLQGSFRLDGNNVVTMSAGCNTISAPIKSWDGGTITLGKLTSTYRACSGLAAYAEDALVRLMSTPFTYKMTAAGVTLSFEGQTLVFTKDLMVGVPSYYRFLSPSQSTDKDLKSTTSKAFLEVHQNGEVTGFTGCRPFRAAMADMNTHKLKDVQLDRRACFGQQAVAEKAFLTAVGVHKPANGNYEAKYVFSH